MKLTGVVDGIRRVVRFAGRPRSESRQQQQTPGVRVLGPVCSWNTQRTDMNRECGPVQPLVCSAVCPTTRVYIRQQQLRIDRPGTNSWVWVLEVLGCIASDKGGRGTQLVGAWEEKGMERRVPQSNGDKSRFYRDPPSHSSPLAANEWTLRSVLQVPQILEWASGTIAVARYEGSLGNCAWVLVLR